jgi:hypothetical protein
MRSYQLFRIGALVLALAGVAHLFGFLGSRGAKPVNGTEFQLNELLYGFKINMMGTMRTQGDIFDGMSLAFTVFMLTLAALGFTVRVERKTAIVIAASLAVMLGISLTYWFIMPTMFLGTALVCFGASAYLDKK